MIDRDAIDARLAAARAAEMHDKIEALFDRANKIEADQEDEARYRLELESEIKAQQATIGRLVKLTKDHGELIARLLGKSNQRDGEIRDAINRLNESVAAFTKSTSSKPSSLISKIFGD